MGQGSSTHQMEHPHVVRACSWCFSQLPEDVILNIASKLSFRDQLALFATCTHLRASERALAGELWDDLGFLLAQPDKVGQLAAWLADRKQHLARLSLTTAIPRAAPLSAAFDLCQHTSLLLGSLAGSTVSSLSLETNGDAQLGGWLRMLPCLRSLTVAAGRVVVSCSLAQATGLTCLGLTTTFNPVGGRPPEDVVLPAACLPPQLAWLEVSGFSAATFWQAAPVGGLQRLQALCLRRPSGFYTDSFFNSLGGYTQLTHLCLDLRGLPGIPAQLLALTGLQQLSLSDGDMRSNPCLLLALTRLQGLSLLKLQGNNLSAVPAGLVGMPALKELDLTENRLTGPNAIPPTSTSLTRLVLDSEAAAALAPNLSRLSSLKVLRITEPDWIDYLMDGQQVGRILRGLLGIPGFSLLDVMDVYGEPDPFTVARQVLAELGIRIPFRILTLSDALDR